MSAAKDPFRESLLQAFLADAPRSPDISLSQFIRESWHVIEPGTPYVHGWHIDAISEHLEAVSAGQIHRLIINMPPRHMKSILVSVCWPAWEWTYRPETRALFASYAQTLSVRDSLKCRRLILSPWYQKHWGDQFQLTGDQNAKVRFENSRTGFRLATSVGGVGTGEGGDRVVVDDAHNAKEAESEAIRTSVLDWWDQAMSTRLNDPQTGAYIIVMQRVHEQDLVGHILERHPGEYEHLCLPARFEPDRSMTTSLGFHDPRTQAGELLWPERFPETAVVSIERALGSYGTAGQLQQRPAPAEGGIFKRQWLKYYQERPKFSFIITSWDTAASEKDGAAYSVGTAWGVSDSGYYLLDRVRERLEYPDLRQEVRSFHAKHRATVNLVEDKSTGQALVRELRRSIKVPVIGIKVGDQDKIVRARAVAPLFEAGYVFFPDPDTTPWLSEYINELCTFPNSSYADQMDSTSQALNYLSGKPYMADAGKLSGSSDEQVKPLDFEDAEEKPLFAEGL